MTSLIVSGTSACLIAADRYQGIVWKPFARKGFSRVQHVTSAAVCWVFGIAFPVISALTSMDDEATNSACLPLGESVHKAVSIVYICLFVCVSITVFVAYIAIIFKMSQSAKITKSFDNSLNVTIRCVSLICAHSIVSITIMFTSGMAVTNNYFPSMFEEILACVVLPLTSCLNPVIYTFSTNEFLSHMNMLQLQSRANGALLYACRKMKNNFH